MANLKKLRVYLRQGEVVGSDYRPDQDYLDENGHNKHVPDEFASHLSEIRDVDLDAPPAAPADPNAARIAQLEALSKSTITTSEIAEYLALKGHGPKTWK